MTSETLDRVVSRLRDRVDHADLLVRAFAEWLGVFSLGSGPVGSSDLWEPREVAIAGLRQSRGRSSSRPFADGLRWLRSREYFRPHVPPVFEADPIAILAVAIAVRTNKSDSSVAWIQDIASRAAVAESDPWRLSLLAAAAGQAPEAPDLAVALELASGKTIRAMARDTSLLPDDVPPERAAVRLAVLTRVSVHRDVTSQDTESEKTVKTGTHVIALHGIRTRGNWQKTLATPLSKEGLIPVLFDYGYFLALQLLIPWFRKRKIEWFHREYQSQINGADPAPHLVAHSFGTYIAAEAMRKYPEIRFSRIILSGSIVQREFPWKIAFERGQVHAVLNESGGRDLPAAFVGHVVSDAGASGTKGFIESHSSLIENHNTHFSHSDVFYRTRATQSWIPFLCNGTFNHIAQMPSPAKNPAFKRAMLVIALIASALLYYWIQKVNYPMPDVSGDPCEVPFAIRPLDCPLD